MQVQVVEKDIFKFVNTYCLFVYFKGTWKVLFSQIVAKCIYVLRSSHSAPYRNSPLQSLCNSKLNNIQHHTNLFIINNNKNSPLPQANPTLNKNKQLNNLKSQVNINKKPLLKVQILPISLET